MKTKTKEPWEMMREEYNSNLPDIEKHKIILKEEHEKIRLRISESNQSHFPLNPFSPLHREYSQQAFNELKKNHHNIRTFFDIEPTPHAAIVFKAIKEGKSVPPAVLEEYYAMNPKMIHKKRHDKNAGNSI